MNYKVESKVSLDLAKAKLAYSVITGNLYWKCQAGGRAPGSVAGHECKVKGKVYRRIRIGGELVMAHRLAWAIVMGSWPTDEVDHMNGNSQHNGWHNLREASRTVNTRNAAVRHDNTSGYPGVYPFNGRWQARINGVNSIHAKHLGTFDTFDEAVTARKLAEQQYGYLKQGEVA